MWWPDWSSRSTYDGNWGDLVQRSLLTLKALTYAPTGGIVAAPTTSLPEQLGGVRNWDYRYCWLRDATFTLYALMSAGYLQDAVEWRDWLLRSVAGDPAALQIMYGPAGERRLTELELPWLSGYESAHPVRIGNDVGLLAEEYEPGAKGLVGNFPQAFTHVSLVNTACNLKGGDHGPARHRSHHHVDG
jgi:GH15 family glucan-1,4-alpha-glucosidase